MNIDEKIQEARDKSLEFSNKAEALIVVKLLSIIKNSKDCKLENNLRINGVEIIGTTPTLRIRCYGAIFHITLNSKAKLALHIKNQNNQYKEIKL